MLILSLRVGKCGRERGAMIVMVYLAISMFLFMTVLFLDIPYLERVGRSVQKAVDSAALAGAIQLTRRTAVTAALLPDSPTRLIGWRYSKRAVAQFLINNPIAGAESLDFSFIGNASNKDGDLEPLDGINGWEFPTYEWDNGTLGYSITITRGVYQRPNPNSFNPATTQIFYPVEVGDLSRGAQSGPDSLNCVQSAGLPTACAPDAANTVINYPAFEDPELLPSPNTFMNQYSSGPTTYPRVIDVANSVRVTLSVSGIPTLFAKIFGFNSFTSIQRTATSVPQS